MSTDINVFLLREQMPSTEDWASAVSAAGFGVELPIDFDVYKHTGYLPCKWRGLDTGFEYYSSDLTPDSANDPEMEPEALKMFADNDFLVSFVVRHGAPSQDNNDSDFNSAYLIAACLTTLSGGTLNNPHCGDYLTGDEAMKDAEPLFRDLKNEDGTDFDELITPNLSTSEKYTIAAHTKSIQQHQPNAVRRLWSKLFNKSS